MYSTPGISHSSFSIGLVTRSSTSRAEAPGICTKTSTIGTMICGSSSRGSFQTAKRAQQQRAGDHQRRQLGIDPGAGRTLPAGPSVRSAFTAGPPRRAPSARSGGHREDHLFARCEPERTSTRSLDAFARR